MTVIAPRDLLLLLVITLIWGFNLVVSVAGLAEIPPVLFTLLRFAILAALLAPWLRVVPGQTAALVVAGLLSGGLYFALMFAGLKIAPNVSVIAIAGQLAVPFTTLLSVALLGEVVRWRRWFGILLSFTGVMIMGFDPQVLESPTSLGLVIASAFIGSLGLIAVKKLTAFTPLELQAWFAWVSVPVLLATTLLFEKPTFALFSTVSMKAWAALLYTALASSLIAHTGYWYLVQRYPVASVAPLTVLSPLFGVGFAVALLNDQLTPKIALGGLCTLIGVVIIMLRERRIVDTGT